MSYAPMQSFPYPTAFQQQPQQQYGGGYRGRSLSRGRQSQGPANSKNSGLGSRVQAAESELTKILKFLEKHPGLWDPVTKTWTELAKSATEPPIPVYQGAKQAGWVVPHLNKRIKDDACLALTPGGAGLKNTANSSGKMVEWADNGMSSEHMLRHYQELKNESVRIGTPVFLIVYPPADGLTVHKSYKGYPRTITEAIRTKTSFEMFTHVVGASMEKIAELRTNRRIALNETRKLKLKGVTTTETDGDIDDEERAYENFAERIKASRTETVDASTDPSENLS